MNPHTDALQILVEYFASPSTWIAVLVPGAIALELWLATAAQPRKLTALQQFLFGMILSVTFSFWREDNGALSLHMLPGYSLVLLLVAPQARPSIPRAYALCFFSLLTADLWCAMQRGFEVYGHLPADFYSGIGGGGFLDALFIVPIGTAVFLAIDDWASARTSIYGRRASKAG